MSADHQYEQLIQHLAQNKNVVSSQMFGKPCLKVNGKAFLALHQKVLVFKLSSDAHKQALAQKGATLWDPSGKGRPMKEWVAIPAEHLSEIDAKKFLNQAMAYVTAAN